MYGLGLSVADRKRFEKALVTAYQLRVVVQVMDLDHNILADISDRLLDGQVNVSWSSDVTRSLTMTLLDPDSSIDFDTNSPADGALYADRMIRVRYCVRVPDLSLSDKWVDVPIFTGPVTELSRDDSILSVEAQGKESLYREPSMSWTSHTYKKGTKLSDAQGTCAIRDLLKDKGGETRFTLPEWDFKITRDFTLTTKSALWPFALRMVGSRNDKQLFYDGRGSVRLRHTPGYQPHQYTITSNHLLSVPKLTYDMNAVRNTVRVEGGTPKGKKQIISNRYLPASHPSSSTRLGRGNPKVKRNLVEVIEDPTIMLQKDADDLATRRLNSLSLEGVSFEFDCVPIPHLEPGDVFHLSVEDLFSRNLRAEEFSIPLKAGQPMSVGTNRKVSINRRRIRRR